MDKCSKTKNNKVQQTIAYNDEKYYKGDWKKLIWHALFDVSNHMHGSFSSFAMLFIIKLKFLRNKNIYDSLISNQHI